MRSGARLSFLFILVFLTVVTGLPMAAPQQASVDFFSPEGTVKGVRQVTARFSEPMVPFGDFRLQDPFEISCPVEGKGRWMDERNWAYNFPRDLLAGVKATFTLRKGLKTVAGTPVGGRQRFSFSTGGPSYTRVMLPRWSRIDENQVFVLALDGEPTEQSVLKNVYFSVEKIIEKVGVNIVKGKDREAVLKVAGRLPKDKTILVLKARQTFPSGAGVKLVWGAGVAGKNGVATDKTRISEYETRPAFTADFSCARERADCGCIPILPLDVSFTSPVSKEQAARITLRDASGKAYTPDLSSERDRGYSSVSFTGSFPEKAMLTLDIPRDLRDTEGRPLANASSFPLKISTFGNPPLAKFSSSFGIVESGDPVLPVTVRNIERLLPPAQKGGQPTGTLRLFRVPPEQEEKVIEWLRAVHRARREQSLLRPMGAWARESALPRQGTEKDFEVVGIPLNGPGLHVAEIESGVLGYRLLPDRGRMYVQSSALVTNLAAHLKTGKESSLVWVTSLDKGLPVEGAEVSIRDHDGTQIWKGRTDQSGIARVTGVDLTRHGGARDDEGEGDGSWRYDAFGSGIFVFAHKGSDMTFTYSGWSEGIESWRFSLPTDNTGSAGNPVVSTVLDRPLFRAGETVHMKHILRLHTTAGFALLNPKDLPLEAKIVHNASDTEYRVPLAWTANNCAPVDWKIPEDAKLGSYRVSMAYRPQDPKRRLSWQVDERPTATFSVEEFRVPLMRGVIVPPKTPLVNPKSVPLDLSLSYLSGGGASGAQVKLRGEIRPMTLQFKGYEDFIFRPGSITPGPKRSSWDTEYYGDDYGYDEYSGDPSSSKQRPALKTVPLTLDKTGSVRTEWQGIPTLEAPSFLHTEMEFRDPGGQAQTAAAKIALYPASLVAGIKPSSWALSKKSLSYQVLALDLKGTPVKNARVTVDLYREITRSHRLRLVGGFYSYQNTTEIVKLGRHFTGVTDSHGVASVEAPVTASGSVILHAEIPDGSGSVATANASVWVAGKDEWWFSQGNDDRIDVLPEKRVYEPGETARLQVRMPFREATALVSMEREGIVDTYVKHLSGTSPVIDIPVKKSYAPNVYISVLAVRGRVGSEKPTAMFDPGKPAYKLGIAEIQVGWKPYSLAVEVKPDKPVYQVRGTMDVRIRVKTPEGAPAKGGEVAVAAVDEGLLELKSNDTWNLLPLMMQRRAYEVETATAQSMVVGKRHFGLKALPHGGGGGRQVTRELFDTLLFWKATVPLDDFGEARVKIPVNDSLTSFRIVAVATAGADSFGTGEATARTTQDLMILSGIPPLVHGGDRFKAMATVRNTTDRPLKIQLHLSSKFAPPTAPNEKIWYYNDRSYDRMLLTLEPGEAREASWIVQTSPAEGTMLYTIEAYGGGAADKVIVTQKVAAAVPVRTYQATLAQVKGDSRIPVARPVDALPGMGGIHVTLTPSMVSGMDGVREYMSRYRYGCLEQRTSVAVALRDRARWADVARRLPEHMDGDGLLKYFTTCSAGSDVLTSYVLSVTHQAGYEIPAYLRGRLISALENFIDGRIRREGPYSRPDLTIRKIMALEAISRYKTVAPARLAAVDAQPNFLPTSAVVDWLLVVYRSGSMPDRDKKYAEAEQVLRSRLHFQGSLASFSGTGELWWLMGSGDATVLKAVIALLPNKKWDPDMGRIMRGAMGRMDHGNWDTTPANAWGTLAVEAFVARFEKDPVTGATKVAGWGKTEEVKWPVDRGNAEVALPWPSKADTLALTHSGTGAPWALTRAMAAIPLKKPVSTGFTVKKTWTPVEQKVKGAWSRGDIVRVRLEMDAQAFMTWVAVYDPVPGGASIVNAGLGSALVASGEKDRWATYIERKFEAFIAYYDYVSKGSWAVEYTLRLNNPGTFVLPSTRVEALYVPEMFGELPNATLEVKE